jgi:hypothetical protein
MFDNVYFRVIFLLTIAYLGERNTPLSIILAIIYMNNIYKLDL